MTSLLQIEELLVQNSIILDGKVVFTEDDDQSLVKKILNGNKIILSMRMELDRCYDNNHNINGWLPKLSARKSIFGKVISKNRYFVLINGQLMYYDSIHENSTPRKIIPCKNILFLEDIFYKKIDALRIWYKVKGSTKKHMLMVLLGGMNNNKVIHNMWMRKLYRNCHHLVKKIQSNQFSSVNNKIE